MDPSKTVSGCPDPSTFGALTVTLLFCPNSIRAIFSVSTDAGLKSSVFFGNHYSNSWLQISCPTHILVYGKAVDLAAGLEGADFFFPTEVALKLWPNLSSLTESSKRAMSPCGSPAPEEEDAASAPALKFLSMAPVLPDMVQSPMDMDTLNGTEAN